jgi:hypothetical protein
MCRNTTIAMGSSGGIGRHLTLDEHSPLFGGASASRGEGIAYRSRGRFKHNTSRLAHCTVAATREIRAAAGLEGRQRRAETVAGPNGGVADSLDEAKAAFRAAGGDRRCTRPRPVSVCFRQKKQTRNAHFEPICS